MRLAIFGPSGAGKSTVARVATDWFESHGTTVEILKLAEPLYDLQSRFYATSGIPISRYEQDQPLLELIAHELRRLSPRALLDDFLRRLEATTADVVINDDLRDPHVDARGLRSEGFLFLKVECAETTRLKRLDQRRDLRTVYRSRTTAEIDLIDVDHVVRTDSEASDIAGAVNRILERIVDSDG